MKGNFPDANIKLVKSSGGTFIVKVDEVVIFDKLNISKTEKIFPKDNEISEKIHSIEIFSPNTH